MKKKRPRTAITPRILCARSRLPISFALACLFFLSAPTQLSARGHAKPDDYALIFGTVWGPDDLPVPGIKVKIRKAADRKARWEMYSSRRGEFEQRVPVGPGDYVIWVETKGYKLPDGKRLQPSPEVTVHVDNNEREDTGVHLK